MISSRQIHESQQLRTVRTYAPCVTAAKDSNLLMDALFQAYLSEHARYGLGDGDGLALAVEDSGMNLTLGAARAVDVGVIFGDHDAIISRGQQGESVCSISVRRPTEGMR